MEKLSHILTPEALLNCYRAGLFPMSDGADDDDVFLVNPTFRGIIPIDALHISRSMRKFMRATQLRVTFNEDFPSVIKSCAQSYKDRQETWINAPIMNLYTRLHGTGHAHSVEVWDDELLVGGLYGVSLNAAFFGESMFSRRTNASKLALIYLVKRLLKRRFILLDTQFLTDHLASMGAIEIPKDEYMALLNIALSHDAEFM